MDGGLVHKNPEICISIDVERDYRIDGVLSVRGIQEGLPSFVDLLRSHDIPFDLFISGETADVLPAGLHDQLTTIGCHGMRHPPGPRSYMNRMTMAAVRRNVTEATECIRRAIGLTPVHFRAPNFSADCRTISVLQEAGYQVDSSVLPGRHVKRWRFIPLLDHRGAPVSPYHPDPRRLSRPGTSRLLEVPLSPNMLLPGGPLGLGFLNARGPDEAIRAAAATPGRYAILLAHSWEMVDWHSRDPVATWVRTASSGRLQSVERFLDHFSGSAFVNTDGILARGAIG